MTDEDKDEDKKFKRDKKAKKSLSDVEKKIEKVKNSKIPESEKEAYIERILGESKKEEGITFQVYSMKRDLKGAEKIGKEAMARSKGKLVLSLIEWDNLFKKF